MLTDYNTTYNLASMPTYSFRSTSTYAPIVGQTSYMSDGSGPLCAPRKTGPGGGGWGTGMPEDDPIGVTPGQAPIGSPLALLVPLLFYMIIKKKNAIKLAGKRKM